MAGGGDERRRGVKFSISRASGGSDRPCEKAYGKAREWYIHIDTLEDLMNLIKETGESIVVCEGSLLIYDDYIE